MPTVLKAADAAEFLSLVPSLLGFHPRDSVVIVPFARSRSLGAMRFDLPPADEPGDLAAISATVVGLVCRVADADAIAVVVYADEPFAEPTGIPRRALVDELRVRADECGLDVTDALCVARDAWGSYLDPARADAGRALSELAPPPSDERPAHAVEADQAAGAELPEPDPAARESAARALGALGDAVAVLCGPDAAAQIPRQPDPDRGDRSRRVDPLALAAAVRLDDLPSLFEGMLGWDPEHIDAYGLAIAMWCLSRPALRDIAIVAWSQGALAGDEALDAQLRWESGEEYPTHLAMILWGEGERPDPARLESALAVVRAAAAAAPPAFRAGPLATAAWISWALGRSTHAESYARRAVDAEPEHGLAEIVLSFVGAAHLPDWAFRRG